MSFPLVWGELLNRMPDRQSGSYSMETTGTPNASRLKLCNSAYIWHVWIMNVLLWLKQYLCNNKNIIFYYWRYSKCMYNRSVSVVVWWVEVWWFSKWLQQYFPKWTVCILRKYVLRHIIDSFIKIVIISLMNLIEHKTLSLFRYETWAIWLKINLYFYLI